MAKRLKACKNLPGVFRLTFWSFLLIVCVKKMNDERKASLNEKSKTNQRYRVVFQPEGRQVWVEAGQTIAMAAQEAGIELLAPCGGQGKCGKCRVEIKQGHAEISASERGFFSEQELAHGYRLACQTQVHDNLVVYIPFQTRLFSQKILIDAQGQPVQIEPVVKKFYLEAPSPTLSDQRGDFELLVEGVGLKPSQIKVSLEHLRQLSEKLHQTHYSGTVVLYTDELLDFETGNTSNQNFGIALDIGTTTIVGVLINLNNGEPLAVASRLNPQMSFGDDVISRVSYATQHHDGLEKLHSHLITALNDLIDELSQKSGVIAQRIYAVTMVGNTVMHHLFLKLPPKYLGVLPYTPTVQRSLIVEASELGLHIHPRGKVYTFPLIAGFVGGDTVGVLLASGILEQDGNRMAVDIGTNGEIMLYANGKLLVASTAAGPAFEGARITYGMRGTTGAIERVQIVDGELHLQVIDNADPVGICGSGLIDVVAELLGVGIIDATGRILSANEIDSNLSTALKKRLKSTDHGNEFVLVEGSENGSNRSVELTQRDVRELQLAKGAIATGIRLLLQEAGVSLADLDEILLAGAFGNYLDRENACRIGLLPDVAKEKIRFIGNAALAGAQMALISGTARQKVEEIVRNARHIELSTRTDFQTEFAEAMLFPHPEGEFNH